MTASLLGSSCYAKLRLVGEGESACKDGIGSRVLFSISARS